MAKLGLLSDSHGAVAVTRRAVSVLAAHGAEQLIHLGDIESPAVLDELVIAGADGEPLPAHVVFGNVDWDTDRLKRYGEAIGLHIAHPVGELALPEGGTLIYTHGHISSALSAALNKKVRYFCHGHSHVQRDERIGATRVINPGALHRAAIYTVALLDTASDALTFYPVAVR